MVCYGGWCVVMSRPLLNKLRKTKRQRLEECLEWDEANESGEVPDQKLEWSMVGPEGDGSLFLITLITLTTPLHLPTTCNQHVPICSFDVVVWLS